MTSADLVVVAGYFPPPQTGGTLATERLASLLEDAVPVERLSLQPEGGLGSVAAGASRPYARSVAYFRAAQSWRRRLQRPLRAVLWASVSGQPWGHLRDVLLVLPSLPRRRPVFAVVHWGRFAALHAHPWLRPTLRLLVRRMAGFVFLDPALADACRGFIPDSKRFVVPNTPHPVFAAPLDEPRDPPNETWRLLFVANMLREKGWETVLQAAGLLRDRGTPFRLTFAGGWPSDDEREAFDALVAAHRLRPFVEHLGPVHDPAALRELYRTHDVLLLPTFYPTEAQPLVVVEALACGTPVVTTRQGGLGGMFTDGEEGVFVPPNDPEALALALDRLLETPERWAAASHSARRRFERQFSPETVRQQWLALLDGTLPPA